MTELQIKDFADPKAVRSVLTRRSVRNKIAVARHCRLVPVEMLPAVAELVRKGAMTWLDRCTLPIVAVQNGELITVGTEADIYLLTPAGCKLCDAEGIRPQ